MSEHILKKDEELFKKRLIELDNNAYSKGIPVFSDFLNLYEQSVFHQLKYISRHTLYGGYDGAERVIAIFHDGEYEYSPIVCIKISSINPKYSEKLSHRDYLGSILGLGIDRSKVGDILLFDGFAYVFVIDKISDYIVDNLTRVKNTPVNVACCYDETAFKEPDLKEITGSISSLRLDTVLSLAFGMSRSKVITFINDGVVFVNGRIVTTNSFSISDGDIISVRHLGRVKFDTVLGNTKKDRLFVRILKYI